MAVHPTQAASAIESVAFSLDRQTPACPADRDWKVLNLPLSDSTTTMGSPLLTLSPGCFSQLTILPSVMVELHTRIKVVPCHA